MQIFEISSAKDVSSLLQASRETYTFARDESMWRMLCRRYGVTNLDIFRDGVTFRKLYTGLLHTYGPLIGLWANDHPYRGNVIEFRYHRNGIIGESWKFPGIMLDQLETQEMKRTPQQPWIVPFMLIELILDGEQDAPPSPTLYFPGFPHVIDTQGPVRIYWRIPPHSDDTPPDLQTIDGLPPTLQLLSPTRQSLFVVNVLDRPVLLPDFPPFVDDCSYDKAREPPRLRQMLSMTYDNVATATAIYIRTSVVGAPERDALKPWAISFIYPFFAEDIRESCMAYHAPYFYGVDDARHIDTYELEPLDMLRRISPRYYPLQYLEPPSVSARWRPKLLNGLWLSANGSNGTQVLSLNYVRHRKVLLALKITGDVHMPRGECAWSLDLLAEVSLSKTDIEVFGKMEPGWKVFSGNVTVNDFYYS